MEEETITIELDQDVIKGLEKLAKKKKISVEKLALQLIEEQLKKDE